MSVRNQVLDGDMVLLQQQEYFLQQQQSSSDWKTAYKLPTSADRLVIEYRNWFDKYCHRQLPWNEARISVATTRKLNENREQVLDRYKQHTQHCSSCRGALKVVQRLQVGLLIYFAIVVSIVALLPEALKMKLGLPLVMTALLGLGGYTWLKMWLSPRFYFLDYIYAQR